MLYNAPSFTSLFCEVWTTGTPLSLSFHFKISPFKLWTFKQVALTCISVLPCASCLPSCQIHPHTSLRLSTNSCAHSPTGRGRTQHFDNLFFIDSPIQYKGVFLTSFVARFLFICLLKNFRVTQVTFLEVFTQPFVSARLQTHRTPTSRSHFLKLNLTILDPLVFLHSHD